MIENSTYPDQTKQPLHLSPVIDIFSGMLTSPIRILNVLSKPNLYTPGLIPILGAVLLVAISALAESTTGNYSASINSTATTFHMLGSFIGMMFFWSVLAVFLRLLAALFKEQTSISSCFVVTGWAFVPLVFRAVATCFSHATVFGDIITWCISIWFLLLQLFAFDSVLQLGRFKTLGIILILPPCLFFAYFISMIFAGAIISDGLF